MFVDTNVLVRARLRNSPFHEAARAALARAEPDSDPIRISRQTAADARRCLESGANIEARGEGGVTTGDQTALHFAAFGGQVEAVTALLDAGANIKARAEDGRTALHFAAEFGQVEAVTALLDAGADPKAKDSRGRIPFHHVEDDSPLKGTDAYRRLHEARF